MFLELENLAGGTVVINTSHFLRARDSYGWNEPPSATVLQLLSEKLFCRNDLADVARMLSRLIPVAELHLPINAAVWLSVDKVTTVREASFGVHHPLARAVVAMGNIDQQVRETVEEARRVLSWARMS